MIKTIIQSWIHINSTALNNPSQMKITLDMWTTAELATAKFTRLIPHCTSPKKIMFTTKIGSVRQRTFRQSYRQTLLPKDCLFGFRSVCLVQTKHHCYRNFCLHNFCIIKFIWINADVNTALAPMNLGSLFAKTYDFLSCHTHFYMATSYYFDMEPSNLVVERVPWRIVARLWNETPSFLGEQRKKTRLSILREKFVTYRRLFLN